jgi:hypothetical protein
LQFSVQDTLCLIRKDIESIVVDIKQQQAKIEQQEIMIDRQRVKIEQLITAGELQLNSMKSLAVITLNVENIKEKPRKLFQKKTDLFLSIQSSHIEFIDTLVLHCSTFKLGSILAISNIIPFDTYFEYYLSGFGSQINFFLFATIDSRLFVEVVIDGVICKQEVLSVIQEGPQSVSMRNIDNGAAIRFKTLDNSSIVRVLEVWNRKMGIFARKSLAAYIC